MPNETRSKTTAKPLTPALSSNLRTRPAHALTPRLAGVTPTSPAGAPLRSLRQQTLSPERGEGEKTISLNSNVTPRSGARISRFETESPSTPDTAARTKTSAACNQDDSTAAKYGLGITSPVQTPTHQRPKSSDQLSFLPTAKGRRISGGSNASSAKEEAKFFRVDDVKVMSTSSRLNGPRPKTTYFARAPSPKVPPKKADAEAETRLDERFVYANNIASPPLRALNSPLAMKLATASSAASSSRSLPIQTQTVSPSVRSPNTAGSDRAESRQRARSNARSTTSSSASRRRSSSLNVSPVVIESDRGHRKSVSASSASMPPLLTEVSVEASSKATIEQQLLETTDSANSTANTKAISHSSVSPRSASLTSSNTAATSISDGMVKPDGLPQAKPPFQPRHTRGSSEATAIQPVTKEQLEAAANARRERKVLDLEISNSSLLAINRTLEKELRKQNAELRRFRRLSRSGRLSLTPSNRIVSGASMSTLAPLEESDQDGDNMLMSAGSSDAGSQDDDDYLSDDRSSSFTESSDILRRRARDEKRLLQDLQRHQQILIDSQKLTQSIQRCLNCTEELIKDGNKALSYQIEPNELQIGGRVLQHDDDEALSEVDFDEYREGMAKPRQGLLSPSVTKDALQEAAMWVNGLDTVDDTTSVPKILTDKGTIESPSPTLEISPILLPQK